MTIIHVENNIRLILKGKHKMLLGENPTVPMRTKRMSALNWICLSSMIFTIMCSENTGEDIETLYYYLTVV